MEAPPPGSLSLRWGNISLSIVGLWVVGAVVVLAIAGGYLWILTRYLDTVRIEHTAIIHNVQRLETELQRANDLALAQCPSRFKEEE